MVLLFRILHSNGFTEEEVNEKRAIVYNNTVSAMCTILRAMDGVLHLPLENGQKEAEKAIVMKVQENGEEGEALTEEVSKAIQSLWADPGVKKAFEMRSEYQLPDSAK